MYVVVDFDLPDGLNVTLKDYKKFDFFSAYAGEEPPSIPQKLLTIEVPNSGGQEITLMKYLVGERIAFRRSLTGLKIIRGLPDYTGQVGRVDLVGKVADQVKKIRYRYQEKAASGKTSLFSEMIRGGSNLCQEISMVGDNPHTIDWNPITWDVGRVDRAIPENNQMEAYAEIMARQLDMTQQRPGFTRRMMEGQTGTVTGRSVEMTIDPESEGIRRLREMSQIHAYSQGVSRRYTGRTNSLDMSMFELLNRRHSSDFDGDSYDLARTLTFPRAVQEEPAPRYSANPYDEVQLASLAQATTELVQGERGRPPASRGPRPRNQRW